MKFDSEVLTTFESYGGGHIPVLEPMFLLLIGVRGSAIVCLSPFWFTPADTIIPGMGDPSKHICRDMMPVYVDEFGEDDIGMKRGQLLYLSEERCAKVADMIISGDFIELNDT